MIIKKVVVVEIVVVDKDVVRQIPFWINARQTIAASTKQCQSIAAKGESIDKDGDELISAIGTSYKANPNSTNNVGDSSTHSTLNRIRGRSNH